LDDRREAELRVALSDAYASRSDLEIMLGEDLGRSLDDLASSDLPLRNTIFRVIKYAKSEGWLDSLIEAVLKDRPYNDLVRAWARKYQPAESADPVPPTGQQLLDTVYFDLTDMRKAIIEAKRAAPSRILGFGVTYSEFVFLSKLCDWLADSLLGGTQRKYPLNLKPDYGSVPQRLHVVAGYRQDLDSANVLCQVFVDEVPGAHIAEFWDAICRDFAGIGHHFVLVFAGDGRTDFPPGVAVLAPPKFDLGDVALWARDMIRGRGWPPDMADAWTDLLCDEALYDGKLNVPALYEAMDRSIEAIRFGPDQFRAKLEGRLRHANTA
jgi:hypothetical protein